MTSFLFIVSFLLHILSIIAIYALSKQLSMNKSSDSSEIVSLMEKYLEEIKIENDRLQQEVSKTKRVIRYDPNVDNELTAPSLKGNLSEAHQTPYQDENIKDDIEVSLQSRILKLYEEGFAAEEIARKLGCGRTEVDLLIKFREKSNI
jgi:DNA-binding NarL/FixJ family response regulator